MGEIQQQIDELKELSKMGMLPETTRQEILMAIKLAESVQEYDAKKKGQIEKEKIQIKYINKSDNKNPVYAKEGDSGFDLRACLPNKEKEVILQPFERMLIPTGLYFELPMGYELQIRPRSGHSFKTGLMVILGTVDTGYRGEIKVIMINLSNEPQKIEAGERVAQGVVASRVSTEFGKLIKLESIKELSETERGSGGFGSTGKN